MKRTTIVLVVLVSFLSMLLSGCSKGSTQTPPAQSPSQSQTQAQTQSPPQQGKTGSSYHISIGTAGTGGYFYPLGGAIADIINKYVDGVQATAEITGGSAENVILVGTNEVQLGMANGNLMYAGYRGLEPYKQEFKNLRGLFTIQPSVVHMITLGKTGIKSIGDLKGKRVVLGPAGGGQIVLFTEFMKHYGITLQDIKPTYVAYTEGVEALLDGNADALLAMAAIPQGAVIELAARTKDWKILKFEDAILDRITSSSPYFVKFVIPKNTYSGLTEDFVTLAATSAVFCRDDLPEDVAYRICKAVYEHLDVLVSTVESCKMMNIKNGKDVPSPLHPGAEKFFKEKGAL